MTSTGNLLTAKFYKFTAKSIIYPDGHLVLATEDIC